MIQTEQQDDLMIVTFDADRLDAFNYTGFKAKAKELIADERKILLDISNLVFIDSSGLGAILSLLRDLRKVKGELRICCPRPAIEILFELVRVQKIVDVYASRQEAIDARSG